MDFVIYNMHLGHFILDYDYIFTYRDELRAYVKANSDGSRSGTPNLTALMVTKWVNDRFGFDSETGFTKKTICNWLHKLNFRVDEDKKVIYFDGN